MCTRCTLGGVGTFAKEKKFVKKRRQKEVTTCDQTLDLEAPVRLVSGCRWRVGAKLTGHYTIKVTGHAGPVFGQ